MEQEVLLEKLKFQELIFQMQEIAKSDIKPDQGIEERMQPSPKHYILHTETKAKISLKSARQFLETYLKAMQEEGIKDENKPFVL